MYSENGSIRFGEKDGQKENPLQENSLKRTASSIHPSMRSFAVCSSVTSSVISPVRRAARSAASLRGPPASDPTPNTSSVQALHIRARWRSRDAFIADNPSLRAISFYASPLRW